MKLFGFSVREYHDAPIHLVPLREEIINKLITLYCIPIIICIASANYPLYLILRKTKPFLFIPDPIVEINEK